MRQHSQSQITLSIKPTEFMMSRPQTGKLMTANHLKNYIQLAQNEQKSSGALERLKPQVQTLYRHYLPGARHFGSLCDKNYHENSRVHQMQKFGRTCDVSQIQRTEIFKEVETDNILEKNKKISYRLNEETSMQSAQKDRSVSTNININDTLNQRLKSMNATQPDHRTTFKKVFSHDGHVHIILFKYATMRQSYIRTLQIQFMDPHNQRKSIKSNHKLFVPFSHLRQLIKTTQLKRYLHDNLSLSDNKLGLHYQQIAERDIITEQSAYSGEEQTFEMGDQTFQVLYPQLQIYKPQSLKFRSIKLTQLQILTLLHSDFAELDLYTQQFTQFADEFLNDELEQQILFLPLGESQQFDSTKKIIKMSCKIKDQNMIVNFRPSWFEVRDVSTQDLLGSRYLSIQELEQLMNHVVHHSLEQFIREHLIITEAVTTNTRSKRPRIEVDISIPRENKVPLDQHVTSLCVEGKFLLEQEHHQNAYALRYKPPQIELYDPVTTHKETKVITLRQLRSMVSCSMRFQLSL